MKQIQRYTILFLLALVAFVTSACESRRTIVNGLDERDANEIVILLAKDDITAYKIQQVASTAGGGPKVVLWDIAVEQADSTKAMAILSENGLPRISSPNLVDLFSESGLVPSSSVEKIRYQAGLADELANTIRKIDGVVDADVRISFPEENALNPNAPTSPITASVYVKHTGVLDDPNRHLISKIKMLVASAVPGLKYDNVTVISNLATFSYPVSTLLRVAPSENTTLYGFTIAKSSATSFRIFFLSTILLLLILCLVAVGLGWKIYPILQKRGGIRQLFHLATLPESPKEKNEVEKKGVEKKEPEKPKEPAKPSEPTQPHES